jgi:magnesium transporter
VGTALTRAYRKGVLEAEGFPVADVSEQLEREDTVVWVDLCGPSRDDLHQLAGELGLHELAVDDALGPHQRPKLDHYGTHLFLTSHAVRVDLDNASLDVTEVDAFIGRNWLITVREDDKFAIERVVNRWDRSPELVIHGVSYLLYGLLDIVVDDYFDVIGILDDYYEEVSDGLFADRPVHPVKQRHWFDMRRSTVQFHRLVVPMREVISGLMRREHAAVAEPLYPYYQDVYDHILRVGESSDALRELVATIVETNLTLRDYRQNQIVKKVSSWAAIIAVPALVTGYYGMNVPFPGFARTWGVIAATALIFVVSFGLYRVFRRHDWL